MVLHSRAHTLYRKKNRTNQLNAEEEKELKDTLKKRNLLPTTIAGPGYRIYYVRYADDFLIGINGNLTKAQQLKQSVSQMLKEELKLTMSEDKTKLTYAKDKHSKVSFLGTEIYRSSSRTNNQKSVVKYYGKLNRRVRSRIPATRLYINMPMKTIVNKLSNQGFCRILDWKQGKITPTAKTAWLNLPLGDIVAKYNSIMRGYRNYYSFVDNRPRMQLIQFILLHSCAKLIARKKKLGSRAKAFKAYGTNLTVPKGQKTVSFSLFKSHKRTGRFVINPPDPLDTVYYSLRSRSPLERKCTICESTELIQMHPIRHLNKDIKGNMVDVMRAMNRKQVVVCKPCHESIHRGLYDGINLKIFLERKQLLITSKN